MTEQGQIKTSCVECNGGFTQLKHRSGRHNWKLSVKSKSTFEADTGFSVICMLSWPEYDAATSARDRRSTSQRFFGIIKTIHKPAYCFFRVGRFL